MLFNAVTGPGIPYTPRLFGVDGSGAFVSIVAFLIFAVLSGFSVLLIIEAMQSIPGNKHFQVNSYFVNKFQALFLISFTTGNGRIWNFDQFLFWEVFAIMNGGRMMALAPLPVAPAPMPLPMPMPMQAMNAYQLQQQQQQFVPQERRECPTCRGRGHFDRWDKPCGQADMHRRAACHSCAGSGRIQRPYYPNQQRDIQTCQQCKGKGGYDRWGKPAMRTNMHFKEACNGCAGRGLLLD